MKNIKKKMYTKKHLKVDWKVFIGHKNKTLKNNKLKVFFLSLTTKEHGDDKTQSFEKDAKSERN